MIPSIDDRLDSMVRALEQVILPALPADRALAIEQAHLILAHIGLIRGQLDLAQAFERHEAAAMIALANDLTREADGGQRTSAAAGALRAAVRATSLEGVAGPRLATQAVGHAIDALIDASLEDGSNAFRASSLERVLVAGRAAATLDRAWNHSTGFEAANADLPPARQLLGG